MILSKKQNPHFDGRKFYLPGHPYPLTFLDFLKWSLTRQSPVWPKFVENEVRDIPPPIVSGEDLRVSWIGHATFLLQTEGLNILTDPVWSKRASPFSWIGPKRVHKPGISLSDLPKIDAILISHNHYDHLDLWTLKFLWERDRPQIALPLGNESLIHLYDKNIEVSVYDWGDTFSFTSEVKVTLVPVQHWSARTLWDINKALWAGFVIQAPGGPIFFPGDTGYGDGSLFRGIRSTFGPLRLALLPIGAYQPRWFMSYSHMDPKEAILAFEDLGHPYAIPMHYNTFSLADDSYNEALQNLLEVAQNQALDLTVFRPLKIGEHWFVPHLN